MKLTIKIKYHGVTMLLIKNQFFMANGKLCLFYVNFCDDERGRLYIAVV